MGRAMTHAIQIEEGMFSGVIVYAASCRDCNWMGRQDRSSRAWAEQDGDEHVHGVPHRHPETSIKRPVKRPVSTRSVWEQPAPPMQAALGIGCLLFAILLVLIGQPVIALMSGVGGLLGLIVAAYRW